MRLICDIASLNYLSAQCPFGTDVPRHVVAKSGGFVSITFRLSALSAPAARRRKGRWLRRRLNYLSAQCPFGTVRYFHAGGKGFTRSP